MDTDADAVLYEDHGVLVTRRMVRSALGTFLLSEARGVRVDVQPASLLGPLLMATSAGVVALLAMTTLGVGWHMVGAMGWGTMVAGIVLGLASLGLLVWAGVHAAGLRPTHVVLLDLGAMRRVAVEREPSRAHLVRTAIEQALQR